MWPFLVKTCNNSLKNVDLNCSLHFIKKKMFGGAHVKKLLTIIIYKVTQINWSIFPGMPFQPSLMIVGKVASPKVEHMKGASPR